ncbi:MAG TPA: hypothetical protein VKE74_14680 [Gemmataceae bacterium]|nr:hypothetical protein [Gemmataceae bacterium]
MNCSTHPAIPAVGICKWCGKGRCSSCAIDTGDGLACRGHCEDRVHLAVRILLNNARVMKMVNAQTRSTALYSLLCGALFLAIGG